MRVVVSPSAEEDLDRIWVYLAITSSPVQADSIAQRLDSRFRRLAEIPGQGKKRDELAVGVRSVVEGPFLILYRIANDSIRILRVVHGARDLSKIWITD